MAVEDMSATDLKALEKRVKVLELRSRAVAARLEIAENTAALKALNNKK